MDDTLEACRGQLLAKFQQTELTIQLIAPEDRIIYVGDIKELHGRCEAASLTDYGEQTTGDGGSSNQDEDDNTEQSSCVLSLATARKKGRNASRHGGLIDKEKNRLCLRKERRECRRCRQAVGCDNSPRAPEVRRLWEVQDSLKLRQSSWGPRRGSKVLAGAGEPVWVRFGTVVCTLNMGSSGHLSSACHTS